MPYQVDITNTEERYACADSATLLAGMEALALSLIHI